MSWFAVVQLVPLNTTALCSPTRAALITGRNHPAVGMGHITENATAAPGHTSVRPNWTAPLPEILRQNGYSTAQFGKCHEVPVWELSPAGSFDRWPAPGNGFQPFYGFLGGETNQWYPVLHSDTTPIDQPAMPEDGYHLMPDLADNAIAWIRQNQSLGAGRPFFVYFAPGATHAPHHVPKEWADRYQGRFDQGWDRVREETFARQKELGVIPADTDLTQRHAEIPAWDDMPEQLKPVLARQMEVYAGFLSYADHHVGRVIDAIEELGELENTLVIYIVGDNGAAAEGSLNRTLNETNIANAPGRRDPRVPARAHRRPRDPAGLQPLRRRLGPRHGHPPISGPSRSPPTGAAPATAPWSSGRAASRPAVRSATSSTT